MEEKTSRTVQETMQDLDQLLQRKQGILRKYRKQFEEVKIELIKKSIPEYE